ncbi:MAG: DUF2062 domain-containing protein [Chthoniobacterales bacterium]
MSDDDPAPKKGLRSRFVDWLSAHRSTLLALDDTPHAIALGLAIGIFFGFTPLLGLKTLLSIGVAWLFKSNKIAAAISVTLHDLLLPFMPAIYFWEYRAGMWALARPRHSSMSFRHLPVHDLMEWTTFFTVGQPLLVGSLLLALPAAVVFYFFAKGLITRTRAARANTAVSQN